jgi:phenylacetyl-CoA:acceptor oxidoreductase subunit 2
MSAGRESSGRKPSAFGPRPWQQAHWDWRAATNFILGGTGSGLIVASVLALTSRHLALLLGLVLVATGLGAVWLEIGRKLRAAHVLFNPFTSWMTRESYAAVLLFALGGAAFLGGPAWLHYAAALAAALFAFCQGRILRASKGIPAWRLPQVVPLVGATALAEGAGLLAFFDQGPAVLGLLAAAVILRAIAWSGYQAALAPPAVRALLHGPGRALMQAGTIAPLALAIVALYQPEAALLAGLAALLTGWWFKFVLVTRAALNQGFSLPRLPVRGTR